MLHFSISGILFQAGFPDDLSENPLDNVELLQDQLECFPYLCRFQVHIILFGFLVLDFYVIIDSKILLI